MACPNELQFVNLSGASKPDRDTLIAVKSHVMQGVWAKHKAPQSGYGRRRFRNIVAASRRSAPELAHSSPRESQSMSKDVGVGAVGAVGAVGSSYLDERRASDQSNLMRRGHGSGSWLNNTSIHGAGYDPFDAAPIAFTFDIRRLIYYATSRRVLTSVHDDRESTLFSYTIDSPALLYVNLSWVAAYTEHGTGVSNCESRFYLQSCVSALNMELARPCCNIPTEGTIAAVACIANMENLNGDVNHGAIHINGLEQMIRLRGGVGSLNTVIRRLVLWSDLLHSVTWLCMPRFPFLERSHTSPLCILFPPLMLNSALVLNPNLIGHIIRSSHTKLLWLLQDMHQLAFFLDKTTIKLITDAPITYPERIYSIEYDLLFLELQNRLGCSKPPTLTFLTSQSIITSLIHGLFLYIYTNLRYTPVGGRIRHTLAVRLMIHLQQADISVLNGPFAIELLWLLFLGGTAMGAGEEGRDWYSEQLWWSLRINSWSDLDWVEIAGLLKGFLWIGQAFFKQCEVFFQEVLEIKG